MSSLKTRPEFFVWFQEISKLAKWKVYHRVCVIGILFRLNTDYIWPNCDYGTLELVEEVSFIKMNNLIMLVFCFVFSFRSNDGGPTLGNITYNEK